MMNKTFIVFTICLVSLKCLSQDEIILRSTNKPTDSYLLSGITTTPNKNSKPQRHNNDSSYTSAFINTNSLSINVINLLRLGASINYTHFFKNNKGRAIEFVLGYYPDLDLLPTGNTIGQQVAFFKDPAWYYKKFIFQTGYKCYFNFNNYLEPVLNINYGYFHNKIIHYGYGDETPPFNIVSRTKFSLGAFIKIGHSFKKGHFIFDSYFGVGCKENIIYENINGKYIRYGGAPFFKVIDNYPIKSVNYRFIPTVHAGILIGFIK